MERTRGRCREINCDEKQKGSRDDGGSGAYRECGGSDGRSEGTVTINPFAIRTVLLARHAQHVVLIHFPIALFTAAVGFDYLAQWAKNRMLAAAAYFNLLVAAVLTVPVVTTGLIAWQWALEGEKLKGILLMHLVLGCVSSVLICLVFSIHFRARRHPEQALPNYRLVVEAVAVLLVGLTGHLGGFLTGVNGPG